MSFLSKASATSLTSSATQSTVSGVGDATNDLDLVSPPDDSTSCLSWSQNQDLLAACSWDCCVRVWQIGYNRTSQPVTMFKHDLPLLSLRWIRGSSKILAAGCDKLVKMHDVSTNQSSIVARHDAPIRSVFAFDENFFITGSWDQSVRGWDLRSGRQEFCVNVDERVYPMDCAGHTIAVVTADNKVKRINLSTIGSGYQSYDPMLRSQLRTIAMFPSANGFALGSIEGRISIQYFERATNVTNYSFKCHRDTSDPPNAFPVNHIAVNPAFGTLVSCGADGALAIWDKDAKSRLKSFPNAGNGVPITWADFNPRGNLLAYSVSYDWSRGHTFHKVGSPNRIRIQYLNECDVKPRAEKKKDDPISRFR